MLLLNGVGGNVLDLCYGLSQPQGHAIAARLEDVSPGAFFIWKNRFMPGLMPGEYCVQPRSTRGDPGPARSSALHRFIKCNGGSQFLQKTGPNFSS
jgi:hypothetical protein